MGFLSDIFGGGGAKDAARMQEQATREATALQREIYEQQREDLAPMREMELSALQGSVGALQERNLGLGADFERDPGYQFRMQEGIGALDASAAARGGLGSGRHLKDLTRFGQGLASQEYQNAYGRRFNQLSALAGIGSGGRSTGQMVQAGGQFGQMASQNIIGGANARAGARMQQAQGMSNLLDQGITAAAMFSDRRMKKDIREASPDEIAELQSVLKAYVYKYKDESFGSSEHVGVMAQDLEKTRLGKLAVVEDENGNKMVSYAKLIPMVVATWGAA